MTTKKKEKREMNPLVAAVIGAGVAVAGVITLKDKKNRKKIDDVIAKVKGQATGYIKDIQNKAQDEKSVIKGKIIKKVKKL